MEKDEKEIPVGQSSQTLKAGSMTCVCTGWACGNDAIGGAQGDIIIGVSEAEVKQSYLTNPDTGWTCFKPNKIIGSGGPNACFCKANCGNGGTVGGHNTIHLGLSDTKVVSSYGGGEAGNRTGWLCGDYGGPASSASSAQSLKPDSMSQSAPVSRSKLKIEKARMCRSEAFRILGLEEGVMGFKGGWREHIGMHSSKHLRPDGCVVKIGFYSEEMRNKFVFTRKGVDLSSYEAVFPYKDSYKIRVELVIVPKPTINY